MFHFHHHHHHFHHCHHHPFFFPHFGFIGFLIGLPIFIILLPFLALCALFGL